MRILAFQSGLHDGSAAAFDDYRLVAAVQEERLRRVKGWGDDVPWLAIDEVLRIAGWSRYDVDAIATIRGIFPLHYYRSHGRATSTTRRASFSAASATIATSRTSARPIAPPTATASSARTSSCRRTASAPALPGPSPTIMPHTLTPRCSTPIGTTR